MNELDCSVDEGFETEKPLSQSALLATIKLPRDLKVTLLRFKLTHLDFNRRSPCTKIREM